VLIVFLNRADGEIVTAADHDLLVSARQIGLALCANNYDNAAFLGEHTVFRRLCVPLGSSDRSKTIRHGHSGDSTSARLVPWILAAPITRAKDISRQANRRRAASSQAESRRAQRAHPFAETRNQYWPAWAIYCEGFRACQNQDGHPRTFLLSITCNPSLEVLFVV
jgi:hypothetical protein